MRLATFVVVSAATLMLLHNGLPLVDTLTALTMMTAATLLMTMTGSARRALTRFTRALVSTVDSLDHVGVSTR
jgi:hypothetical protein